MRHVFLTPSVVLALAVSLGACSNAPSKPPRFDTNQFAQLRFLEGRYSGVGPDGRTFHDEYLFTAPDRLVSNRHADATFAAPTDGSTVELVNGAIISTWGEYTWKAVSVSATRACFEPISAPSAFCWERTDADTITVTQRWNDADGQPQSTAIVLQRVRA